MSDLSYMVTVGNDLRKLVEMNYPAASHGVSKARQQYENHLEASFGVWIRGAITHKE